MRKGLSDLSRNNGDGGNSKKSAYERWYAGKTTRNSYYWVMCFLYIHPACNHHYYPPVADCLFVVCWWFLGVFVAFKSSSGWFVLAVRTTHTKYTTNQVTSDTKKRSCFWGTTMNYDSWFGVQGMTKIAQGTHERRFVWSNRMERMLILKFKIYRDESL